MGEVTKSQPFDDEKNTPLHFAAAFGNMDALRKEIESGHKIDPENYMGWTPLMMAVRHGFFDAASYLIEQRADATKLNGYGKHL